MKMKIVVLFFALGLLFSGPGALSQGNDESESDFGAQSTGKAPTPIQAGPERPPTELGAAPIQPASTEQPPGSNRGLQPAGQMVWVSGVVKASYPDQTPRVLARGSMIYEKDKLTTEASGSGQIAFTDNSMLTLTPSSIFVIEQYYYNPQKPQQDGQAVMSLIKGGLRTVTGFVAKAAPTNYQVKTPVATIGVRGTDFQTTCPSSSGQCAFGLLHGAGVTLTNAAGIAELTPAMPYATIASYQSKAVLSRVPASLLGAEPIIQPAATAAPSEGGGNCGILIN